VAVAAGKKAWRSCRAGAVRWGRRGHNAETSALASHDVKRGLQLDATFFMQIRSGKSFDR